MRTWCSTAVFTSSERAWAPTYTAKALLSTSMPTGSMAIPVTRHVRLDIPRASSMGFVELPPLLPASMPYHPQKTKKQPSGVRSTKEQGTLCTTPCTNRAKKSCFTSVTGVLTVAGAVEGAWQCRRQLAGNGVTQEQESPTVMASEHHSLSPECCEVTHELAIDFFTAVQSVLLL